MKNLKRTLALTLVLCMLCSLLPVSVLAAGTAPTNNLSTTGSPFQAGTGNSNSFRIPALVTLSDGTLVAAADARWNTTYDGGGLDTMIAISKDDGATWTHSFANYLGDNGNEYNGSSSTAFIDPALAVTSNDTIYMLVDLYPYGIALNGKVAAYPNTDTGFTDDGYLKLDYNSAGTYGYYLKDGKIYAIEVKKGEHVRSRSLSVFKQKYSPDYAIRFSQKNFGWTDDVISIPLYAAFVL